MDIKDYRTLGILASPFMGVNHLANIISTSPLVAGRKRVDNYLDYVLAQYESNQNRFHVDEFHLFGSEDYQQAVDLVTGNELTTVLPGHTEDAFWVLPKLQHLGRLGLITLEIYEPELFYNETRKRQTANYNPYLYRFLYRKDVVARLFNLPEDDIFAVDIKDFFTENADPLISALNDVYQLDLNLNFCKKLHSIWYAKVNY
jgi:hypothetical protein